MEEHVAPRRAGTREEIQRTALELFIEQGYDKTSLREIAERVGVTKAALYYHFPTKDKILESVVADLAADVDELIAWGGTQPRTPQGRAAILERVAGLVRTRSGDIIRLGQANQTTMRSHDVGDELRERLLSVFALVVDPDADVGGQIRALLAIVAVYVANIPGLPLPPDLGSLATASVEDRSAAAMKIALELIGAENAGRL
jgi:AcrR family transcriptional regulator